jgi:predicted nuclease of restriction endonuclease-like (RecB) superfamily
MEIKMMLKFYSDIRSILAEARNRTYSIINSAMVETYWLIGKRIFEEEQQGSNRATYGEKLLENLSKELTSEFGKGFSYANLRNMRQFYLTYPDEEIRYTLCSKLSWSHNRLIMRIDNQKTREYYLQESLSQNWSVRQLERNIQTMYYQRILSSKDQQSNTDSRQIVNNDENVNNFIKDPYVFEFLNIPQPSETTETNIEKGLIANLQKFLLELGKGFSFVAQQQRISTETEHFYIDLVFYNYYLKCFVLLDLKTGKLTHQDIGQMDMYRRMYDDLKKPEGDNPTIGIILCTDVSETVVKYSIMKDNNNLFATKYMPYLPTKDELIAEIEREKSIL